MLTKVELDPTGLPGTTRRTRSARQLGDVVNAVALVDAVQSERYRSDRSGKPCSVAAFKINGNVEDPNHHSDTMRVAWSVLRVARASDIVGTLDDSTVCVVMPDTGSEGADAFCAAVELDPSITTVTFWWTHTPGEQKPAEPIATSDLLPWFVSGFRPHTPVKGVHAIADREKTLARLRYEKARADRSARPLTVVVVRPSERATGRQMVRIARKLIHRKRRTDFVGRVDDRSLCFLLPDTDAAGARRLADQILSVGTLIGSVDMHSYPSGWFSDLLLESAEQEPVAKVESISDRFHSVQTASPPPPRAPAVRATVWPPKYDLFGVEVSATDYVEAVNVIITAAHRRESGLVTFLPVHGIVTAAKNASYRYQVNAFDMVAPDGMPVRWALNYLHKLKMPDRVCGPEAMTHICRRAAQDGIGIYLYGSTVDTLNGLKKNLLEAHPDLRIVGVDSPPFRQMTEEEISDGIDRINASGAGLVFIGLGCPRQDTFAYHNRNRVKAVQLCVGAAFDFHAGVLKRPPVWMQKWGLEWTYRLTQEPRRLFKRYMVTNTSFVWMMANRMFRGR